MANDIEYQKAFQEFKDAGFSDEDASIGAQQRIANAEAQVASAMRNGGGFIGDPFQPGSNTFIPNARANTATGTVLQPAGQENDLPGVRFGEVAQQHIREGADPELVAKSITVPAQNVDSAIIKVAGSHNTNPALVNELKQVGGQALEDYTKLINAGTEPTEAYAVKVLPFLNRAGEAFAQNRYREPLTKADPLSRLEWQKLSDARIRLRSAEKDLIDPMKRMNRALIEKQVKDARDTIQQLEAKAGGGPISISAAGTSTTQPRSDRFNSEAEARSSGAKAGDVVYLIGVGRVRLR